MTVIGLSSAMAAPAHTAPSAFDASGWEHADFNMTRYLVGADEARAAHEGKEIHRRGQPGVYYCEHANWGWPCWWQPAVKQCVNKPNLGPFSLGPDKGVNCAEYQYTGCTQRGINAYGLNHPGDTNVQGWYTSFKCSTQEILGGADP